MNQTIATTTETLDEAYLGPERSTVVRVWPAYCLIRRSRKFGKPMYISSEDRLGLLRTTRNGEEYCEQYRPGSVVSYALKSGDCPIKAVEDATKRGHDLHWINGCATVISSTPREQYPLIMVEVGQLVTFEGRVFEIVSQPNRNLGLKFISLA